MSQQFVHINGQLSRKKRKAFRLHFTIMECCTATARSRAFGPIAAAYSSLTSTSPVSICPRMRLQSISRWRKKQCATPA